MTDLISRADAIEVIQNAYCKPCKERGDDYNEVRCRACEYDNAIIQIDALPSAEAEPKENHTQATGAKHVIKSLGTDSISHNGIDCTEFIHWLMEEVMDDEMWELNAVGNGEIICRKLKKLGLLDTKDGYYIRHTIDAVEVVRCKDCKWSDWYKALNGEHRCYCMMHGTMCHKDDEYCSYGEREESEVEE